MKTEPIISTTFFGIAATAIIAVLTEFGLDLTTGQTAALLGLVAVVSQVIVALVARTKVTPNAKVVETVEPDGTRIAGEASPLPTGTEINSGTALGGTAHEGF
jgi:hypothetical protein